MARNKRLTITVSQACIESLDILAKHGEGDIAGESRSAIIERLILDRHVKLVGPQRLAASAFLIGALQGAGYRKRLPLEVYRLAL